MLFTGQTRNKCTPSFDGEYQKPTDSMKDLVLEYRVLS